MRMTWDEIVRKYPGQWVGLTDVESEDGANVDTAVVKYTDKTADELLMMQLQDDSLRSVYTTPDDCGQLGFMGMCFK